MATYGLKSLTVGNDTYEINTKSGININGTSWDGSSSRTIYAPISAGTNGYFLKSNGSGAPTWASISTSSTPVANTIAKFDSSAHMNSADMTAQEISAFVNTVPSGFANLNNLSVINNIIAGGDITDGAGNVLANKDTSAWAYMYISSKQLNNTETKITGLTLRGGGNYTDYFDLSTADQIKIKKAGEYHVEIYMSFTSVTNAANVKRIVLFKNGASGLGCLGRPNSYENVTIWDVQTYAVNDVLTMYGRSEDGNATVSWPRIFIKPLF